MPRRIPGILLSGLLAAGLAAGCEGDARQSAMAPAGPAAAQIAGLWWIMCAAFSGVFGLVLVLLALALRRPRSDAAGTGSPRRRNDVPPLGDTGFVVAGGILLPVVVMVPILFLSLGTSAELRQPEAAMTVRVVGHMWWWEVAYPEQGIVTANEIHVPVGERIRLELESADVVHSFWVPSLNGKRDLIPGMRNEFWLEADEPGVYRGQCAEYCGVQHANMILFVVALPRDEFDAWLATRSSPRTVPDTAVLQQGERVFRTHGCATCHAVQGTPAVATAGPDLTHFGSRRTIAGVVPNTHGNLTGWIADPHAIKAGVRMPRTYLYADDLLALAKYLESLQ